jgi:hypothetical protein
MARNPRQDLRYNPRAKTKRTYPSDWNEKGAALDNRDGDKCSSCGKSRKQLNAVGLRLEKAHIFSVRTGNNRKTNLVYKCTLCHSRDPKHNHLHRRNTQKAQGYGSLTAKINKKAQDMGLKPRKSPWK